MELHKIRYLICTECEHFNQTARMCKICKCFMVMKTHFKSASCPIGKWNAVTDNGSKCGACSHERSAKDPLHENSNGSGTDVSSQSP